MIRQPCEPRQLEEKDVPTAQPLPGIPADLNRNVFAMDASSHYSRPGPRIAEGILAMADLFRQPQLERKSVSPVRQPTVRLRVGNRP